MAQSPNPHQMYGNYPPQGYAPQYQPAPECQYQHQYTAYSPQPPQQAQQTPPPLQPTPEPAKDSYYGSPPPQQQQQQQQQHQSIYGQPQMASYMTGQPAGQYPQQAVQQSQPLLNEGAGAGGKKNKWSKATDGGKKSRITNWLFGFSLIEIGLLALPVVVSFQGRVSTAIAIRSLVVIGFSLVTAVLACVMPRLSRNGKIKALQGIYSFLFSIWVTSIVMLALSKPWGSVSNYTRRDLHFALEPRKGGKGGGGGSSSGGSSSGSSSTSDDGTNLVPIARILTLVALCIAAIIELLVIGAWVSMCIRVSKEKKRYAPVQQQAWPTDHHRSVDMGGQPDKPATTV